MERSTFGDGGWVLDFDVDIPQTPEEPQEQPLNDPSAARVITNQEFNEDMTRGEL